MFSNNQLLNEASWVNIKVEKKPSDNKKDNQKLP